jgi:hypothetical protein
MCCSLGDRTDRDRGTRTANPTPVTGVLHSRDAWHAHKRDRRPPSQPSGTAPAGCAGERAKSSAQRPPRQMAAARDRGRNVGAAHAQRVGMPPQGPAAMSGSFVWPAYGCMRGWEGEPEARGTKRIVRT